MLQTGQNKKTSFSVHNEMMKKFRRAHGRVAALSPIKIKGQDTIFRTRPMAARHVCLDKGGLHREKPTLNWFICPPLPKVAGYKLSPN